MPDSTPKPPSSSRSRRGRAGSDLGPLNLRRQSLTRVVSDIGLFSRLLTRYPLRPYQEEPARAIIHSVLNNLGLTFTVMMSRQSGKNELSAQVEALLLTHFQRTRATIVKTAPTLSPQLYTSIERLEETLDNPLTQGRWKRKITTIHVGQARIRFLSGLPGANVVSSTASLLLEVDEAQFFDEDKYLRDFRPMGASTNVTTVLYGIAWTSNSLLEHVRLENRRLEAIDGIQRNFFYPWTAVVEFNAEYRAHIQKEQLQMGDHHPLFRTQYALETLSSTGGMLSEDQLDQLRARPVADAANNQHQVSPIGEKSSSQVSEAENTRIQSAATARPAEAPVSLDDRQSAFPLTSRVWSPVLVAAIDLAGEDEEAQDAVLRSLNPRRDSTAVTIARVTWETTLNVTEPRIEVLHFYWWTGRKHSELLGQLVDLLTNVWPCRDVVIDATGIGAGIASFLVSALGSDRAHRFTFTAVSKSALGYQFLSAINSGRLKVPGPDPPVPGANFQLALEELWKQAGLAESHFHSNERLDWGVDPRSGHDDLLVSLALAVEAAQYSRPRVAIGRLARRRDARD